MVMLMALTVGFMPLVLPLLLEGVSVDPSKIARSLVLEPAFILLDEPFSGIDPLTVVDIQKIIGDLSREGIGVLVTDHQVRETLSVTHRAYIVQNGKVLAAGTPEELSRNAEVRRVYLGDHFRLN